MRSFVLSFVWSRRISQLTSHRSRSKFKVRTPCWKSFNYSPGLFSSAVVSITVADGSCAKQMTLNFDLDLNRDTFWHRCCRLQLHENRTRELLFEFSQRAPGTNEWASERKTTPKARVVTVNPDNTKSQLWHVVAVDNRRRSAVLGWKNVRPKRDSFSLRRPTSRRTRQKSALRIGLGIVGKVGFEYSATELHYRYIRLPKKI